MLAPVGIAQTDHLHPLALLQDHIVAVVDGDFGADGPEELRRRRGSAGGEEEGEEERGFHGREGGMKGVNGGLREIGRNAYARSSIRDGKHDPQPFKPR